MIPTNGNKKFMISYKQTFPLARWRIQTKVLGLKLSIRCNYRDFSIKQVRKQTVNNKSTWPVEGRRGIRGQAEELTKNFRYYVGEMWWDGRYTHESLYYMSIHNDAQVRLVFIDISKKYKYKLSTFITRKNYPLLYPLQYKFYRRLCSHCECWPRGSYLSCFWPQNICARFNVKGSSSSSK